MSRVYVWKWAHRIGSQKAPHRSGSNVGDSDWASIVGLVSSWYQHRDIVLMSQWVRHRFGRTLLWQIFGTGAVKHGIAVPEEGADSVWYRPHADVDVAHNAQAVSQGPP